jgi:formylglycine-generating enzyme required for sulfatase activity
VNCVNIEAAVNFCWWEGKHLVTEAAWDYVARNGALRTRRPFDAPDGFDPCAYADVFRTSRCVRGAGLSPIDAFPLSESRSPAGVFGLWGGVRELVQAATFLNCDFDPLLDGAGGAASRGLSAFDEGIEANAFDASSTRETRGFILLREHGFRCARWVPEPRETRVPGTR